MASYLITGCSHGLGLAMAEHLMTLPSSEVDRVFATARHQSPALKALVESSAGRLTYVELDATNEQSVKAASAKVEFILDGAGLDVLINNAGKMRTTPEGIINMCFFTLPYGMAHIN
jgi:NAD(P)-dependent dehydrogenase (short-subunit alcohol dehydrogenase family)